jgi:hypothetical protein
LIFPERSPESDIKLIVCGDFNGGDECAAVSYLQNGFIDSSFYEDGEPVTSSRKVLPLNDGLVDAMKAVNDRVPPPTLVVPELITLMVDGTAYENPNLSKAVIERLTRIFYQLATVEGHSTLSESVVMQLTDVEKYLTIINKEIGRGSEFREAARQMGWKEETDARSSAPDDDENTADVEKINISLPQDGFLTLDGFIKIYESELQQGKFWGIAHDLALLGEPLPQIGVFQARFDRIFHSVALKVNAVIDFTSDNPCPNANEPSDHLPVTASFVTV